MSTDAPAPTPSQLPDVHITKHAHAQWTKRAPSEHFDADLRAVFEAGIPIGLPPRYTGHARLHPPTGMILLFKTDRATAPAVITVLIAEWIDDDAFDDDHLKTCEECALRYDPAEGPCPWHSDDEGAGTDP